jgi:hypothetical protein
MSDKVMFRDIELKTDKLDSEFTLRIPEVAKRRIDRVDASRKKVLNKHILILIDQFLYAEDYEKKRGFYLSTEDS